MVKESHAMDVDVPVCIVHGAPMIWMFQRNVCMSELGMSEDEIARSIAYTLYSHFAQMREERDVWESDYSNHVCDHESCIEPHEVLSRMNPMWIALQDLLMDIAANKGTPAGSAVQVAHDKLMGIR